MNLIINVDMATITVAMSTPLALESCSVCMNRKKAARFNMAPILINLVKTP